MDIRKLSPVRVNPVLRHPHEQRVSLDGAWRFRLDPQDQGLSQQWQDDLSRLDAQVAVPGCWQGQGHGHEGTDRTWDFQIEARVYRATYKGTGWYGREFPVPVEWRGRRVWLNFGGVHPSAEVWLNGRRLGENDRPFVPFGFEITGLVVFDRPNALVVRVHEHNRQFGLAFNFQGNWSGLYRGVELTATGAVGIAHCAIYPDGDRKLIRITAELDGAIAAGLELAVSVAAVAGGPETSARQAVAAQTVELTLPIEPVRLWSPDEPNLYRVDVALRQAGRTLDALIERVGFVKLSTRDKHFLINGQPYYMRGTGDFVSCPETGCPDTDRERWRRKLRALREYGYNYVRCQSYLYAPEYFDAADEVGLLIQSEMGMLGPWGGTSPYHVYQWPKPTPDNYPTLKRHWDLSLRRDVNHPSANLYCMSNEYGASTHFPRVAWECYRDTKAVKPTALVIWTDGGYNADLPGDFVNDEAAKDAQCPGPLIQHEYRWWSSYPDVRMRGKYTGALRPYAIDLAIHAARARGLERLLERFAQNSQQLQFLEAKAKMELCRRDNPRLAGICHFNAMDALLSPQGVLTEFYQHKHADSATWLHSNGDTVVLAGLGFDDRVLVGGQTFQTKLSVSDFSHPPLAKPSLQWRLTSGEATLAAGELSYAHQPYVTCAAGEIAVTIPAVERPAVARLEACVKEGSRAFRNQWNLWLLPSQAPLPPGVGVYGQAKYTWLKTLANLPAASPEQGAAGGVGVVLTERLDEPLVRFMRAGGRVVLAASEGLVRPHPPNFGFINYFFCPPANYGPYEDGQNGTIIAEHPMLGDLPHQGFADFQFFRLMDAAPPLDIEPLGLADIEPVIRVIHRYPVCHPLAYLTEGRCGRGGLVLSALELDQKHPEARCLLGAICNYAAGKSFAPKDELSQACVDRLIAATALG